MSRIKGAVFRTACLPFQRDLYTLLFANHKTFRYKFSYRKKSDTLLILSRLSLDLNGCITESLILDSNDRQPTVGSIPTASKLFDIPMNY